jgi:hypothetical protein
MQDMGDQKAQVAIAIKAPAWPCFNIINVLVAIPNILHTKRPPAPTLSKKVPNSTQIAGIKIARLERLLVRFLSLCEYQIIYAARKLAIKGGEKFAK